MLKSKIAILLFLPLSLFISSCGDDDSPSYDFPITVTFQGAEDKETMIAFTKTGGTVTEISLDDTDLDDDDIFTEVDTDPSFDLIKFISDTEVQLFNADDLILQDTFMATYSVDGDDINIALDFSDFGSPITLTARAKGTLESFKILSQAYVEESGIFTLGTQQFYQDEISTLTALMDDESTLVILNYNQRYE